MEVPISSDASTEGFFRYTKGSPADKTIQGVFAFTFYDRGGATKLYDNLYLRGMSMYSTIIRQENSVFTGWRILVYMDAQTYESLQIAQTSIKNVEEGFFLVNNPLVDCVIVDWPYYNPYETIPGVVNGDVLRCMRLRAFFDFRHIPVFIRDADTIFTITIYETQERVLRVSPELIDDIYKWETNYYEGAQKHPNTWIFGTSLGYKKYWHENVLGKQTSPLGAFAGLQSTMPTVPCFTETKLWDEAIDYILKRSVRSEEIAPENTKYFQTYSANGALVWKKLYKNEKVIRFSNEDSRTRVGKDEQILLFVFLPKCLKHCFFFELDMVGVRKPLLGIREPNYPAYIFKKGSNTNLQDLFQKGFAKETNENLEAIKVMISKREDLAEQLKQKMFKLYLEPSKSRIANERFLEPAQKLSSILPILRNVVEMFDDPTLTNLLDRAEEIRRNLLILERKLETILSESHLSPEKISLLSRYMSILKQFEDTPFQYKFATWGFSKPTNKQLLDYEKVVANSKQKKNQFVQTTVLKEINSPEKAAILSEYDTLIKEYNEIVDQFLARVRTLQADRPNVKLAPYAQRILNSTAKKGGQTKRQKKRRSTRKSLKK